MNNIKLKHPLQILIYNNIKEKDEATISISVLFYILYKNKRNKLRKEV